mmetsp:Transcript_127054/g.365435  ORF Transcript_127054/g.365435 Transcript_127054/m.365435 type:complete len:245 (+) Transcript_127054:875-1609(+)
MQHQQDFESLNVWERQWNPRDLHRVVVSHHAPGHLLESAAEDWGLNAEHAATVCLHDELVNPMEDQLDLRVGLIDCDEARSVDALGVDELEFEGSVGGPLGGGVHGPGAGRAREVHEDDSVEHADQANQGVLKHRKVPLVRRGALAKCNKGAGRIEPLARHLVHGRRALPKARVRLRCAKDDDETQQRSNPRPNLARDCVVVGQTDGGHPLIQLGRVKLHEDRQNGGGHGDQTRKGENAATKLT